MFVGVFVGGDLLDVINSLPNNNCLNLSKLKAFADDKNKL